MYQENANYTEEDLKELEKNVDEESSYLGNCETTNQSILENMENN